MKYLPAVFALLALLATAAHAQTADDAIDQVPATATFVISGGFWEDTGTGDAAGAANTENTDSAPSSGGRRGYYKLISIRQPDATARIYLQQIQSLETGPKRVNSVELEELTAIRPYVTDIRPEDSRGVSSQPGFLATVYLKTDAQAAEPESWTVIIDELGEISVARATN